MDIKIVLTIFLYVLNQVHSVDQSRCGESWEPFKDEKCFKIFGQIGVKNHEEASKFCQDINSTLITIHEKEEEEYLVEFFKSKKVSNDVWIGVNYRNNKYKWNDGSDVVYQNWAPGSPKQKDDHCVQFDFSDESLSGKWSDVMCTKMNMVACQKSQEWTFEKLKSIVIDLKKSVTNPIPIGFTYVQLPQEKEPSVFWPGMNWKDVTSDYAGVFFRAGGGEAAPFGEIQMENTKRISKIDHFWDDNSEWEKMVNKTMTPNQNGYTSLNGSSYWISTGGFSPTNSHYRYMKFETSIGEIRPKNMAIKIWRRIN